MHLSKAHTSSASLGRERSYDTFAFKFAYILLAAMANGSAWWLLASIVCSFVGDLAGSAIPAAVGLMTAGATFVGLLALSQR
jgi:hypothetical protein